ncbi:MULTISPECIES: hypothetical protein [Mesorhizobium]|uniref:Oligosaccharide repeat unit polymerase n=1 Tax=Mesorhizobium denitrificans TaxID=2294114 RepID=A0A371XBZ8_9HYPH|nr:MULTISPECIES: hypothetical protein [Mesorhizobium]RFC66758.1 hypothetical protein DY251_14560 [Mesorhizobium denitrificans]
MEKERKENRFYLLILYYLMFAILAELYIIYIAPVWGYMGFDLDVDRSKIITSICVLTAFVIITPAKVGVRSFFLNLAITLQLIPSLILYSLGGKPQHNAEIIWTALLIVYAVSAIPVSAPSVSNLNPKRVMLALAFATGALLFSYLAFSGLSNFNLDLRLVYDFRDNAAASLPGIFGYLTPIFSKIVVPFGVVVSLYYKKPIFAVVFLAFAVIMFGFTGHKGIVLYIIMSIGIFFALKFYNGYLMALIGVMFLLVLSYFDAIYYLESDGYDNWGWFVSIIARRGLMVPTLLDYFHIAFFQNNDKYLWSTSRLTLGLVVNPYGVPLPNLIGSEYLNSDLTAANTGYIGSGFAQAGFWGVVFYSAGVGLVLAYLNAFGRKLGLPFVASIVTAQVATMFSSTDFITLFLTHGMLVSIVLLAMISAPEEKSRKT